MYCSKIEGNEKADLAAKEAAHRGGRETDCWSSLAHIKNGVKENEISLTFRLASA